MLQRFDSEELALAFLTDHSPYFAYRNLTADEPYSNTQSVLQEATRTASREGHAWLVVIYKSDDVTTWGTRKVNLVAGGSIRRRATTTTGAWTGGYVELRYEIIARSFFNVRVGRDSNAEFVIIKQGGSFVSSDLNNMEQEYATLSHPLLGDKVPRVDSSVKHGPIRCTKKMPSLLPQPVGCVLVTLNHTGETEKWILRDIDQFNSFRFMLTEFVRRHIIRPILFTLNFVGSDDKTSFQDTNLNLSFALSGHFEDAISSIDALTHVISDPSFSNNNFHDSIT